MATCGICGKEFNPQAAWAEEDAAYPHNADNWRHQQYCSEVCIEERERRWDQTLDRLARGGEQAAHVSPALNPYGWDG